MDIKASEVRKIAENTDDNHGVHLSTLVSKEVLSLIIYLHGYGLDDQGWGFHSQWGWELFSFSLHPDRLWGPPSLLCNGYQGLFPQG
jgi:hypothetical protein